MTSRFQLLQSRFPKGGLFRDKSWRLSPSPVALSPSQIDDLSRIGQALYNFSLAANKLYHSPTAPAIVRDYLDRGKPRQILDWQNSAVIHSQVPVIIRPDLLITPEGFRLVEIDSLPGGIGTLDLLHETYSALDFPLIRTGCSMTEFFARTRTHFVFSEEGMNYFPEIQWLVEQSGGQCQLTSAADAEKLPTAPDPLAAHFGKHPIYRFFELWDPELLPSHRQLLDLAAAGTLTLTPPPKAFLEEKLLLALFWLPDLHPFWRQNLTAADLQCLESLIPKTWVLDPRPIPKSMVQHGTHLASWRQLASLSLKDRRVVVKISGFSENAWGSRGVHIGHDENQGTWQQTITSALASFGQNPYILQPFEDSLKFDHTYFDESGTTTTTSSVARINPYYQIHDNQAKISSVMAIVCPSDKKKIHGMNDASLVPCATASH